MAKGTGIMNAQPDIALGIIPQSPINLEFVRLAVIILVVGIEDDSQPFLRPANRIEITKTSTCRQKEKTVDIHLKEIGINPQFIHARRR